MTNHICPTCKDPFYTKTELDNHKSTINKCEPKEKSDKILLKCICKCGKELTTPERLKNHILECIVYKNNIDSIININNITSNEIFIMPYLKPLKIIYIKTVKR